MTGLLGEVRHQVSKVQEYIMTEGKDPEGTFNVPKFENTVFKGADGNGAKNASNEDRFSVNTVLG